MSLTSSVEVVVKRVWRYQRGNQNPYNEEEQTTQWSKEKVQKDKTRSTKHTYKTKDRVARTPLNTGGELRCSGRVRSSCSTIDIRRVNLVTNPVISREWGKDREVFTTGGPYSWSFVTQIFLKPNRGLIRFPLLPYISPSRYYIISATWQRPVVWAHKVDTPNQLPSPDLKLHSISHSISIWVLFCMTPRICQKTKYQSEAH
jgi:hypothetical protein